MWWFVVALVLCLLCLSALDIIVKSTTAPRKPPPAPEPQKTQPKRSANQHFPSG